MIRTLAILRGINVGGHRKILMADLKAMMEQLGFSSILTYIQSGNVWFDAEEGSDPLALSQQIEQAILDRFGHEVPVIIRTLGQLEQAVRMNRFYREGVELSRLHLTFLSAEADTEKKAALDYTPYLPDQFHIVRSHVFLYLENKYHQTKLSNAFFEKKLGVKATTRNWKTVLKLLELAQNP